MAFDTYQKGDALPMGAGFFLKPSRWSDSNILFLRWTGSCHEFLRVDIGRSVSSIKVEDGVSMVWSDATSYSPKGTNEEEEEDSG